MYVNSIQILLLLPCIYCYYSTAYIDNIYFNPIHAYIHTYTLLTLTHTLTTTARDLLSRTLVPDPHKRIKLSELRQHAWMQGADSGPEPSKGDNAAATAGSPAVCNINMLCSVSTM